VERSEDLFLLVDVHCALGKYLVPLEATGATYEIDRVARWWLVRNIQSVGADADATTRSVLQRAVDAVTLC
jgi:hypothetical protein